MKKIRTKVKLLVRKLKMQFVKIKGYLLRNRTEKLKMEEKEQGLALRCEWCPDNIFCPSYGTKNPKKGEIIRCDSYSSER